MTYNDNGLIVYEGPSYLDGSFIVAIVTGLTDTSRNPKTGDMLQLWILQCDKSPCEARRDRTDMGICGDCPIWHACYVEWKNAPTQVWKAYRAGRYDYYDPDCHDYLFIDRKIRLGACGEPVALPYRLVKSLADLCMGHTGYTHQWRKRRYRSFSSILMASCETWSDTLAAQHAGWRTFRIVKPGEDPVSGMEARCPASKESGMVSTCEACTLCAGRQSNGRSIAIQAHGSKAKLSALLPILEGCPA